MNCFNNSKIFDSLLLKRAIKKAFPISLFSKMDLRDTSELANNYVKIY